MHYLLLFFLFISTQTVQFIQCQEIHHTPNLEHLDFADLIFHPVGGNTLDGLPAKFRLILGARCTDQPGTFRDFFSSNQSNDTYRIFVSNPQPGVFKVLTEQPSDGTAQEYQFELPKKPKPLRLEAAAFIPKSLSPLQQAEQRIKELAVELATKGSLTPEERQRIIDEMAQQQAAINELSKRTTFIFGGPINPDLLAAAADQQSIAPTVPALTSSTPSDSISPTNSAASTEKSFAAVTAQEPEKSQKSATVIHIAPLTANPQTLTEATGSVRRPQETRRNATHKPVDRVIPALTPEELENMVKQGNIQILREMGISEQDITTAQENNRQRQLERERAEREAAKRAREAQLAKDKEAQDKEAKIKKAQAQAAQQVEQKKQSKKADNAKLLELQQAQELQKNSQEAQGNPGQINKKPQPSASADSAALRAKKADQEKREKEKEQEAAQKKKKADEKRWLERVAAKNAQAPAATEKPFDVTKKITTEADATVFIEAVKKEPAISSDILHRLSEILYGRFNSQLRIAAARIALTKDWKILPKNLNPKKEAIITHAQQVGQELQDPITMLETIRRQVNKGFIINAQEGLTKVRKIIDAVTCSQQRATLNGTFDMVKKLVDLHTVKTTLALQEGLRGFPGLPPIILSTETQPQNTEGTIEQIIKYLDGKKLIMSPIIGEEVDRTIARLLSTITDDTAHHIIRSYKEGFEAAAQESLATLQQQLTAAIAILSGILANSPDQQALVQEMATINIPTCLAFYKRILSFPEAHTQGSTNNRLMLNFLAQLLEVIEKTKNRLALGNPELVKALEFFTQATTNVNNSLLITMLESDNGAMKNSARNTLATKLETLKMLIENPNIKGATEELACQYFKNLVNLEVYDAFPDELHEPLRQTVPKMLPIIRANTYKEANDRFKKLPQSLQKKLKTDFKSFLALPADTVPTVKHKLWKDLFSNALNSYTPALGTHASTELFLVTLANTISFEGANQNLTPFFTLFLELIEKKEVSIDPALEFLHILNIGEGKFSLEEKSAHSNCITALREAIESLPEGQEKNKFMELFELYFKKYKQDELK